MKKLLIIAVSFIFLSGCSTTEEVPEQFEPKEETNTPWGCQELRQRNPEADC